MQALILALVMLMAGGGLAGSWQGEEYVAMTDGANPFPPKN